MKKLVPAILVPLLTVFLAMGYNDESTKVLASSYAPQTPPPAISTPQTTPPASSGTQASSSAPDSFIIPSKIVPVQKPVTEPESEPEYIPESNPEPQPVINEYAVFYKKFLDWLRQELNSGSTEPIVFDTGVWISFKEDVYQLLQDSGRAIQITFLYEGQKYRIDIPAQADLISLIDENGYCGFLNLMAHFGGTRL